MKPELIPLLECPSCHQDFQLSPRARQAHGEILSGELICLCREIPIIRGIPRFVDLDDSDVENFGYEWNRFQKTQLDSHTGLNESEKTFVQKTGWTPESIQPSEIVLDAGCSTGRYLEIAARSGATVIGVDLSTAVEVSMKNVGHLPNVHIVQADLHMLPFKKELFDKIYSIGVLMFTPSAEKGFQRLIPFLKPAGEIAVWVYRKIPFLPETWTHMARCITREMDYESLIDFCQILDKCWYPIVKNIRIGRFYPLQHLLFTSVLPYQEWRILNNFDCYAPKYLTKHTPNEVKQWFHQAGLSHIRQSPFATTAVAGRKPKQVHHLIPKALNPSELLQQA